MPGQALALAVTNKRGVTVIQKGVRLTESMIARLKKGGVQRIFVEDERYDGIDCHEGLDAAVYSRLEGFLTRMASSFYEGTTDELGVFARELTTWSQTVCDALESGSPSFLLYPNTGDALHRWTSHVVNVALLAGLTYLSLGGKEQARHVITAAFVQDLGLWRFGESTLMALYTDGQSDHPSFEQHVAISLNLAHTVPGLSSYVKAVVAQHHERCDGSGYPKGLYLDSIHPLARVMGVVDSYVAVTQKERDPLLPHDALEWLMAGVGFEFDHAAVKAFRNAVYPYPPGIEVELSTGERGVVSGVQGAVRARPTVRILYDAEGREITPYYEIDLAAEMTKGIRRLL